MKSLLHTLALLLFCLTTAALAQATPDAPAASARAPFTYALGQTTLDEARQYWSRSGATVLGGGHLAMGGGKGMDGMSKTSLDKVLLVDVSGADYEGISIVRFGFYENRLYRIQAALRSGLRIQKKGPVQEYTADELAALEARLRKEYGAPGEARRTLFADKGQKNDLLVWRINGNKLSFESNSATPTLVLSNDRMEAQVQKDAKEYCKTVNTKEHIVCW